MTSVGNIQCLEVREKHREKERERELKNKKWH